MVFSFPYVREVVDAVRASPGRRFEHLGRQGVVGAEADGTAPYVKGAIHPAPRTRPKRSAAQVEAWLAEAVTGWSGASARGKLGGAGLALETIGELPEELAARPTRAAAGCGCRSTRRSRRRLNRR